MAAHTVRRRGTDSSNRGIFASDYMWEWWLAVVAELGFEPVITQGAWMTLAGGGAGASAGYHDGGGCFDLRVRDLTPAQVLRVINVIRHRGGAGWLRNLQHGGFDDPHIHLVLGTDYDLDDGAAYQWRDYIAGGDGMDGSDYHPRPHPLVTTPPEDDMPFTEQELRKIIREEVGAVLDEPMNAKDPKGDAAFVGVSLRRAIKDIYRALSPRGKK